MNIINLFLSLMVLVCFVAGLVGVIFTLMTREDAFRAAEKLTKPAWLAILLGSLVVMLVVPFFDIFAIVAIIVFWVDVYPKIKEILSPRDY